MLKKVLTSFEFISAIVVLASASAIAAPLENWRFDPGTNQLEVTVPAGIKPRYSFLANPARIVLDLPNTQVGQAKPQISYSGAVRQVRVFQFQPDTARIVLELAPNQTLGNQQAQKSEKGSDRWTLQPVFAASAPSAKTQAVFSSLRSIQTAPVQPSAPIPQAAQQSTPTPPVAQASEPPANDFGLPPAPPTINPAPPTVTAPELPPVQPSSLPSSAGSGNAPNGSSLLFPSAPVTPQSTPQRPGLQLPEVNPSLAIPDSFPPINAPSNLPTRQPTVTVPQIDRPSSNQPTAAPRSQPVTTEDTPVPRGSRTIRFGQPLPTN
jgi:hypothetical protein